MNDRTPAPWILIESHDRRLDGYIRRNHTPGVLAVAQVFGSPSVRRANGTLIANAPDMLAALERVKAEWIESGELSLPCVEQVITAIMRATGKGR